VVPNEAYAYWARGAILELDFGSQLHMRTVHAGRSCPVVSRVVLVEVGSWFFLGESHSTLGTREYP
jgi:hypothetical protein